MEEPFFNPIGKEDRMASRGKRFIPAVLGILMLLGGVTGRPALAFWDDIHYFLTYVIARYVGFTPVQAYRIACANLLSDYNEKLKPDQIPKGPGELEAILKKEKKWPEELLRSRWRYHAFRNESEFGSILGSNKPDAIPDPREADVIKAIEAEEKRLFERAQSFKNPGLCLHFVQDRFSHEKYGSIWAHLGNPLYPEESTEKARQGNLAIGGTVDWLSAQDVALDSTLVQNSASKMQEFMRLVIPQQTRRRNFSLLDTEDITNELRAINLAPEGLKLDEMPLYAAYYLTEDDKNIKTKNWQNTFAGNYHKVKQDTESYLKWLGGLKTNAPVLTQAQKDFFSKHKYGPDLGAARQAVLRMMKDRGLNEFKTSQKEQEFLDLNKARNKYTIDNNNRIQPRDELVLAGNLDISVEGISSDPQATVEVAVKMPPTMPDETEYALGDPRPLALGSKATWENVPVGEVIVEASKGGRRVGIQKNVEVSKASNEVILRVVLTDSEEPNLEEGWYVIKFEQVISKYDAALGRTVKVRKTWYAPKKIRGQMKKTELLAIAQLEVPEAKVAIFSGPFATKPRDFPAATEVIIGNDSVLSSQR
jgi:hypothetical protein